MNSLLRLFFTLHDPNVEQMFITDDLRRALCFNTSLFLMGPPQCGKTSLMWTYCQSLAAEGEKTLVLCTRRAEQKGGAPLVSSKSSSIWKLLEVKYVEN